MVEQEAVNFKVAGSSPAAGATLSVALSRSAGSHNQYFQKNVLYLCSSL